VHKKFYLVIIISLSLIITSCWDNVEIDERAFITSIGYDNYEKDKENEESGDMGHTKRYLITYTYPNVGLIAQKEEGDPSYVFSTVAATPYDARMQVNSRSNKNIFLGHTEIIVIGEELAKDREKIREILDEIHRSRFFGKRVRVLIAQGKAQDILRQDSGRNMDIGLFIEEVLKKEQKSYIRPMSQDLLGALRYIRERDAAIMPRIYTNNKELLINGAAIIKDYKLVGWLDPLETRNVNILTEKVFDMSLAIEIDGLVVSLEEVSSKRKMKLGIDKEGRLEISFHIQMEGNIGQHVIGNLDLPLDSTYLDKVDEETEKALEKELMETFNKIRDEYSADIYGLREYLRRHEPDFYEKYNDKWEEVYKNALVNIDVTMHVRRVGVEG